MLLLPQDKSASHVKFHNNAAPSIFLPRALIKKTIIEMLEKT
jgi:hypothetical protein